MFTNDVILILNILKLTIFDLLSYIRGDKSQL